MAMADFTDAELTAFLEESLPANRSSELEHRLRLDAELRKRLIEIQGREAAGLHTIGAIWRRNRLSCPTRVQWGQFVLGTLDANATQYMRFHLDEVGCRYCQANLTDLQEAAVLSEPTTERRQRYFQTSVGHLRS